MATRAGRACATQAARASGVLATRSTCPGKRRSKLSKHPPRQELRRHCLASRPPGSLRGDPWSAAGLHTGVKSPDCRSRVRPRRRWVRDGHGRSGPIHDRSARRRPILDQGWATHNAIHAAPPQISRLLRLPSIQRLIMRLQCSRVLVDGRAEPGHDGKTEY